MDRFPTPPDPPEDVACCPTCHFYCYPEELILGGCAHCGGELQTEDYLMFWRGRPLVKPLAWIDCPVYQFNSTTANWVPRPK